MASVLREGTVAANAPDMETYRLRRFIEQLVEMDLAEIHEDPIDLIDLARVLDGNPKAVLFKNAGPEGAELVGGVTGSRARCSRRCAAGSPSRSLWSRSRASRHRSTRWSCAARRPI